MKPKDVFQRLEQVIGITGSPQRLREAIETELRDHFGLPSIQAAEKAEQMEEPVRQFIARSRMKGEESGSYAILSLSIVSDRIVLGSCCVESADVPEVAAAKRRRLH